MTRKNRPSPTSPTELDKSAAAAAANPPRRAAEVATMQDVADLAGVSRATVSKFFNGSQGLKAETRAKIEKACLELQYVPDIHAVSLVKGRSNLIGVVLPNISEPFFAEAVRIIEEQAAAIGLQLIIQCSYNKPASEAAALLALRSLKVNSIILTAIATRDNAELLERLGQELHIVYLDSYLTPECDFVMNDNLQTSALLTRYLVSKGHRPAFLGAPPVANPSPQQRLAGYLATMREAGMDPCVIPTGDKNPTWAFEAFAMQHTLSWLGNGNWKKGGPTALVCGTDRLAIGAMAAFRKFGLAPGRDVAVVGHDDLPICEFLNPALTSVKQDIAAIGHAIIECIRFQANPDRHPQAYYQRTFPGSLMVRESA